MPTGSARQQTSAFLFAPRKCKDLLIIHRAGFLLRIAGRSACCECHSAPSAGIQTSARVGYPENDLKTASSSNIHLCRQECLSANVLAGKYLQVLCGFSCREMTAPDAQAKPSFYMRVLKAPAVPFSSTEGKSACAHLTNCLRCLLFLHALGGRRLSSPEHNVCQTLVGW